MRRYGLTQKIDGHADLAGGQKKRRYSVSHFLLWSEVGIMFRITEKIEKPMMLLMVIMLLTTTTGQLVR